MESFSQSERAFHSVLNTTSMAAEGELDNVHRQEGEEIMEAEEASDPESSGGEDSDDDEERQAAIDTLEAQVRRENCKQCRRAAHMFLLFCLRMVES